MMQPLPTEIVMLGLGTVLLLVQLFLQSISSTVEMGGDYKAGPRDEPRVVQGYSQGAPIAPSAICWRRFRSLPALALLVVTGRNGGLGTLGAEAWVVTASCTCRSMSSRFVRAQPGLARLGAGLGGDAGAAVSIEGV
jgi:uncharacterized MAPEG superfamily protein